MFFQIILFNLEHAKCDGSLSAPRLRRIDDVILAIKAKGHPPLMVDDGNHPESKPSLSNEIQSILLDVEKTSATRQVGGGELTPRMVTSHKEEEETKNKSISTNRKEAEPRDDVPPQKCVKPANMIGGPPRYMSDTSNPVYFLQ